MLGEKPPGPDWKPNTKYLYSLATSNGWTRENVHTLIGLHFKKQSTKDLSYEEYNKVINWLADLPAGQMTTEVDPNTLDLF